MLVAFVVALQDIARTLLGFCSARMAALFLGIPSSAVLLVVAEVPFIAFPAFPSIGAVSVHLAVEPIALVGIAVVELECPVLPVA